MQVLNWQILSANPNSPYHTTDASVDVYPDPSACNGSVVWETGDPTIVTLPQNVSGSSIPITAAGQGSTTITANFTFGGNVYSISSSLTVGP
jgi:hypothetical protein